MPVVEWWDSKFVGEDGYESVTGDVQESHQLIDNLIQHPVSIEPPSEPGQPAPRELMLTKKERKKLRRQRRQAALKEKQDKIRLGLLPRDEPKVKISNLMAVLGQEAVLNPTLVEARVRQQMAARKQKHIDHNAAAKLTQQERSERKRNKLLEDTSLLVQVAVFR